jgi:hypothetical protein
MVVGNIISRVTVSTGASVITGECYGIGLAENRLPRRLQPDRAPTGQAAPGWGSNDLAASIRSAALLQQELEARTFHTPRAMPTSLLPVDAIEAAVTAARSMPENRL